MQGVIWTSRKIVSVCSPRMAILGGVHPYDGIDPMLVDRTACTGLVDPLTSDVEDKISAIVISGECLYDTAHPT